jgi:hypothetical protein
VDRRAFVAGAATLVVAPRGLLRAPGREIALVTADEESRLVALDLRTGRFRRYVRTLPKPRSIEAVGPMAVVAHSELGAVTIVRAATLRVEHVLRGFGEPRYTAAHPDGRHAYVTDARRGQVVALDVLRGRVVGRARVGRLARHVTIAPGGRALVVALGSKAAEVALVDLAVRTTPGSCDDSGRPSWRTTSAGLRTANRSGSAPATGTSSRSTAPARVGCCGAWPPTSRRSTSPSAASWSSSPAARAGRCASTASTARACARPPSRGSRTTCSRRTAGW